MDLKKGAGGHLQQVDKNSCYSGKIVDKNLQLENHYQWAVKSGLVSPLISLTDYIQVFNELNKRVIGKIAADGTKIEHITYHCIDRLCGTTEKKDGVKHDGIDINDFEYTLFHGKVRKSTEDNTIIFLSKFCRIALNPIKGVIKQCNKL